jgi:lipopolysaccharide transport system ATP-binding protein
MSTAINVKNLGKKYILNHQSKERYTSLRDVIANGARHFANNLRHPFAKPQNDLRHEEFWALQDVSFDIQQGDRVGVIGRNGAGKSTLLKILSRITEPTVGRVKIKGRVASLLEVGTGFHPELTGRENIFLNGAILGMHRSEIKRKFDEIVDFSEVEQFLDTPVKRFSSGMYVRLAFAVAAHLEPEVLIVDEVLAVGDAQFQKKCMGKMQDVGSEGRTVLFVSHNMNAIEQLCTSAICFSHGSVSRQGKDVRNVIKEYLASDLASIQVTEWVNSDITKDSPWFSLRKFCLTDAHGNTLSMPVTNDTEIWVQLEAEINEIDPGLTVGYQIYAEGELPLYWSCQADGAEQDWPILNKGINKLRSKIPSRFLNEGSYRIEMIGGLYNRQWLYEPNVNSPSIYLNIQGGLSDSPYWMAKRPGILAPIFNWECIEN